MSYQIYLTDGTLFATVANNTLDTSSSMTLIGQDYPDYGDFLDTNFIHLLENSSNITPPPSPLTGQLWWNLSDGILQVYNGTVFRNITGSTASPGPPPDSVAGDLWFNTLANVLCVFNGNSYIQVGPTTYNGTGALSTTIVDTNGVTNNVIELIVSSNVVGVISDVNSFTPANAISGFGNINPGITLANSIGGVDQYFSGTSTNSLALDSYIAADFMKTNADTGTTGNITADYYYGNGAYLTGLIGAAYSNSNVSVYLASGNNANNIITTANVQGLNGIFTNKVTANLFVGNFQGNISGNLVVPGANTQVLFNNSGNAGADIGFTYNEATQTANIGNTLNVAQVNASGNVSSLYVLGNGAYLTDLPGVMSFNSRTGNVTLTNADVANALGFTPAPAPTGNSILYGNGSGGFSNVVIGANLTFSGGVLDAVPTSSFPSGTRLLFQQSTAPTGWTQDTTYNNYALRITSGTVTTGGTVPFTTAFGATNTVDGTAISVNQMPVHNHGVNDPGHTHTVTDRGHNHGIGDPGHNHGVNDPTHSHGVSDPGHHHLCGAQGPVPNDASTQGVRTDSGTSYPTTTSGTGIGINGNYTGISLSGAYTGVSVATNTTGITNQTGFTSISTGTAGNNTAHSHTISNLAVQYIDAIIAVKN